MKKIIIGAVLFAALLLYLADVSEAVKNMVCIAGMIVSGIGTLVVLLNAHYRK